MNDRNSHYLFDKPNHFQIDCCVKMSVHATKAGLCSAQMSPQQIRILCTQYDTLQNPISVKSRNGQISH